MSEGLQVCGILSGSTRKVLYILSLNHNFLGIEGNWLAWLQLGADENALPGLGSN